MRLLFALFVFFIASNSTFTQVNIKPTLKTSYSYMLNFGSSEYYGYDLSVGGGIRVKDQTTILFQANYLRCSRDVNTDNFEAFQMLSVSLSLSYRFLKMKHKVSPLLELDAGINRWSNADNLYISNSFIIYEENGTTHYKFYDNSIIGKTKLLLNVNLKQIDLNIGTSFNTYFFHLSGVKGGSVYSLQKGIGFEAQVLYTFPMKKQQAKKAVE